MPKSRPRACRRALALLPSPASPARAQVVPPNPPPSFAPQVGGSWGPILLWPHVPVSIANLPDGRILTFASNEANSFPGSVQDEYTHAAVWDPKTGTLRNVPHPSHDMFCAALVMLESGEPFVMGGRNQGDSPWTSFYDFRNDQWVQIENMNGGAGTRPRFPRGNGEVHRGGRRRRRQLELVSHERRKLPPASTSRAPSSSTRPTARPGCRPALQPNGTVSTTARTIA
jgi:hypothetical protein